MTNTETLKEITKKELDAFLIARQHLYDLRAEALEVVADLDRVLGLDGASETPSAGLSGHSGVVSGAPVETPSESHSVDSSPTQKIVNEIVEEAVEEVIAEMEPTEDDLIVVDKDVVEEVVEKPVKRSPRKKPDPEPEVDDLDIFGSDEDTGESADDIDSVPF